MSGKNIQVTIKKIMEEQGATYESIAKKMGCSRENVWMRLNQDTSPSFATMRKILNALGCDFVLSKEKQAAGEHPDREAICRSAERSRISYADMETTLGALDIDISIGKKNKNNS